MSEFSQKERVFRARFSLEGPERLDAVLRQARSNRASGILLPWKLAERDWCLGTLKKSAEVRVFWQLEWSEVSSYLEKSKDPFFILDETLPSDDMLKSLLRIDCFLDRLKAWTWQIDRAPRIIDIKSKLIRIPKDLMGKLEIEALPWHEDAPFRFTSRELFSFLQSIQESTVGFFPRGPRFFECFDDRIPAEVNLDPLPDPNLCDTSEFDISVIIPTYNNREFAVRVISNLLKQTMERERFEIIVVDDGSRDGTFEALTSTFSSIPKRILKVAQFKRTHPKEASGEVYRAGIARNLGAKIARGRKILFLDSDILVSSDFLSLLAEKMDLFDVIQAPRYHLKASASATCYGIDQLDFSKTYIAEKSYWEPFFTAANWQSLDHFWKYTCTYALLIDSRLFWAIGGFKRNFIRYGFEDVDLGYEAYRRKAKFHLLSRRVVHLTPPFEHHQYGFSELKRNQLLSYTAQVFYRQHLDPRLYRHFAGFMGGPGLIRKTRFRWRNRSAKAIRASDQISPSP